jgi:murein L,D-transpeptidase YafK
VATVLALSGCASKFKSYNGPEVTHVVVNKGARKMYLLHHDEVLKSYGIGLGFAPIGHKRAEGDGRTPEGSYVIDRRNPNSQFHLSIGINYPRDPDRRSAREAGVSPGGDIFIHGRPWKYRKGGRDWTAITITP